MTKKRKNKKQKATIVVFNGTGYYLTPKGYYLSKHYRKRKDGTRLKKSSLLHRDMWASVYGKIPDGYCIHHIDHDKSNNSLSNFQIIEIGAHVSLHYDDRRKNIRTGWRRWYESGGRESLLDNHRRGLETRRRKRDGTP